MKMKLRKRVLELRPTQFAVGMLEVDEKIKSFRRLTRVEQRNYVRDNPVPVVLSPDGSMYVIDHHHFLCVAFNVGLRKVRITVVDDLSGRRMTYRAFWKWMTQHRNCYPFCQFGEGPRNELYLPKDIRGLADDPYRSLAWYVRKAGAFENSEKNFAEFTWANFFRKKKLLDKEGLAGFDKALIKAVRLAQSRAARRLPGYGKLNLAEHKKLMKRTHAKASEARKLVEA